MIVWMGGIIVFLQQIVQKWNGLNSVLVHCTDHIINNIILKVCKFWNKRVPGRPNLSLYNLLILSKVSYTQTKMTTKYLRSKIFKITKCFTMEEVGNTEESYELFTTASSTP